MIKRLKVRWMEIHEQYIECDPEDHVLEDCDVNIMAPTYKSCTLQNVEIVGDVERDEMYESKKRKEA